MNLLSAICTYHRKPVTNTDCLACFSHPNHAQIRRLAWGRDGSARRVNCVRMHLRRPAHRP